MPNQRGSQIAYPVALVLSPTRELSIHPEGSWILLVKPSEMYKDTIRTILVMVRCLHVAKKNSEITGESLWDELQNVFNTHEVRPSENDLLKHSSLIRDAVNHDERLSIQDLINKFNSTAQQIYAVKFAHEFELLDVFPPVPLLEAYLKESKKVVQEVLDKGKHSLESQNEAIAREFFCLESMIKCIYKYNLETQFPCASLQNRIEELGEEKSVRKQVADQKRFIKFRRHQQSENKRSRPATSNTSNINMSTNAPSSVNYLQHKNYVPELAAPYLSSSAHLGLVGTDSTIARYLSAIGPSGMGWD